MRASAYNRTHLWLRLAILMFGIAGMQCVPASSQTPTDQAKPTQKQEERFWLAGRYDGNRVIVYFDAVKFNGTMPSIAQKLPEPEARGFFAPVKLPLTYVAKFQTRPGVEHFVIGERYDLLLDYGKVATVTLTTLVGAETDEGVGNDSFIGALATLDEDDVMYLSKNYYVVRRHREMPDERPKVPTIQSVYPGLFGEPVRFDIQTEIVALLTERMKSMATETERRAAEGLSPIVNVQAFRQAGGTLRYYAGAAWNSGEGTEVKTAYALAAWISPLPKLHILEVQTRTSGYDGGIDSPTLLNVVDLGEGRTGIIVSISGGDSGSTDLLEYRDSQDIAHMRVLQCIGAGE
jgi:hypothetical protein